MTYRIAALQGLFEGEKDMEKMDKSITVLIPAYNEQLHLKGTVLTVNKVLAELFKDYEIMIINDNSKDQTGQIAEEMKKGNDRIKVFHNSANKGLGYNYRRGIQLASKEYFGWVPGDNDIKEESISNIFSNVGETDIIIPYTSNPKARTLFRRLVSSMYTNMLNLLFGLNIRYYNGIAVYRTEVVRKVKVVTNSFAFQAGILIKLLKRGHTYKEVPMKIKGVEQSSLFRINNLVNVARTIVKLFYDLRIRRRNDRCKRS